ncbi:glycosyltransferase family 2 protein [Parablastomonas sp. CN1-191]|uniref:glycosyltransferase family 2 protein n=1 Tax=Parablastomonas sp. CN1-191 TaxID=3400908 RepID=UPI003BF8FF53
MLQRSSPPRGFAITYTIKDEAALLPGALAWHRALGCRKFYIFLDGTSDAMRDWLPTQPDVVVRDSIRADDVIDPPAWIDWVRENEREWMDVRKNINSWVAARTAAADGIAWLAAIDPDELILPHLFRDDDPAQMEKLLAEVPASCDQVFLPNCDLLPTGQPVAGPFEQRYFLSRLPRLHMANRILRKIAWVLTRSPVVQARVEEGFYRLMLGDAMPRTLRDPATGEQLPGAYFLSYDSQKAILRTARYARYRPRIHYWEDARGRRNAHKPAWARVLHFDLIDVDHFMHKFRQRRGTREGAQSRFAVRHVIADIAMNRPEPEVRKFFLESLCVGDPARRAMLARRGLVRDLPRVEAFFAQLRASEPRPDQGTPGEAVNSRS